MIDDKIKTLIGELVFQNAVLVHQVEELQKQLKDKETKETDEK